MQQASGGAFALAFVILTAVRDVHFSGVFRAIGFWGVMAVGFGLGSLVFCAAGLLRRPGDAARIARHPAAFFWLNLTTAIAWTTYFFALERIEPAIVNTVYSGMGPLAILGLGRAGVAAVGRRRPRPVEVFCHAALAASLLGLGFVALSGRSGLDAAGPWRALAGLAGVGLGGATMAVTHLFGRHLSRAGVGAEAVFGSRCLMGAVLAAAVEWTGGASPLARLDGPALADLAAHAFLLIMVPSYLLQMGVARADPRLLNAVRALGPVAVFTAQRLDGRILFSGWTLAFVLLYCAAALAGSVLEALAAAREACGLAAGAAEASQALPAPRVASVIAAAPAADTPSSAHSTGP